jgi:hypothetical protein
MRAQLQRLRDFLDRNLFAFLMLFPVVYLLFAQPQVSTLWQELPFAFAWKQLWTPGHRDDALKAWGFILLVVFLGAFFLFAWLNVYPPVAPAAAPAPSPHAPASGRLAGLLGLLRRNPFGWLTRRLAAWPAAVAAIIPARVRSGLGALLLLLALALLPVGYLEVGPAGGGRLYPLAGCTLILVGWLLLFTALWFWVAWGGTGPGAVGVTFGRVLGLVWATALIGELGWVLADKLPGYFSYRVYTIGAVFHLAFLLLAAAALVDIAHRTWRWPVRPVATFVVVVLVLFCLSPSDVAGVDDHANSQVRDPENVTEPDWYDHLLARIRATDGRGPVVFVAASGGGSRAAVFTALCLEYLDAEPLTDSEGKPFKGPDGKDLSWSNQVVVYSSVSGGSLAAAYHVHARINDLPHPRQPQDLRNCFAAERDADFQDAMPDLSRLYQQVWRDEAPNLDANAVNKAGKRLDQSPFSLPREADTASVDDMATDFMAPLARGVLTPGLSPSSSWRNSSWLNPRFAPTVERGTSLCRFWEQRFGWSGCDNLSGYGPGVGYVKETRPAPLVLFNATRAREGTRFVISFPPLPRGALRVRPTEEGRGAVKPDRDTGTQTLSDFWPRYRLSLGESVRLSANFPWGLHTGRLWKEVVTLTPAACEDLAKDENENLRNEMCDLLAGDKGDDLRDLFPDSHAITAERLKAMLAERLKEPCRDPARPNAAREVARRLEELSCDPRVPPTRRGRVRDFLDKLRQRWSLPNHLEDIDLLDGGVNDNTGLPTLWEVVQHLHDLAATRRWYHPPTGPAAKAQAILRELRQRGVVLVEIDSGAKPNLATVSELRVPSQALENAGYASAFAARDWYLERISRLLAVDDLPEQVPTVWVRKFTCNHSQPGDVLTAWALAPSHKARILATFACECVEWEELKWAVYRDTWLIPWEVHKGLRDPIPAKAVPHSAQKAQEMLLRLDQCKRNASNLRMK